MAIAYFKVEQKGELSADEAQKAVGEGAHLVVRTDVQKGKTTIHFAADEQDARSADLRSRATAVKLKDIAKL